MVRFLTKDQKEIFFFNHAMISNALPVNNSAHAIITRINHKEKANPAIIFISPNGTFCNHAILVIENVAHKAIYIHANSPETNVLENLACAFFSQISKAFAVISAGDKRSIIQTKEIKLSTQYHREILRED